MIRKRNIVHALTIIALVMVLLSCSPATFTPEPPIPFTPPAGYTPTIFDVNVESPASQARLSDSRPNIIVIMTDDQPFHTVAYMPTVMKELIPKSVNFTNGFVTTPLCCPSRVSILTGEYVHNHHVFTDRMPMGGAPKFNDTASIATWMKDAGYRTAYFGKYLNGYDGLKPAGYVPPGWDEWGVFYSNRLEPADDDVGNLQYYFNFSLSENGKIVKYPRSKANFGADVLTKKSVDFINQARDEPFFLFVGYYNPHSPYVSAPRHSDTFRAGSDWNWIQYRPPDFNEKDISDKPAYLGDISPLSETKLDASHKQILRSLLSVDDGVASILNALHKTGLGEKTIIFYLTDNGTTVGDHRFGIAKNCPYEACLKVPFIVYAPGMIPARSDDHLVANIDLAPTFIDLAGGSIPKSINGMSLLPLLKDSHAVWRDDLLFEHWPTEEGVGSMVPEFYAVRNAEWKYVEYVTGEKELYDLVNDPYELNNLAGKSKYQEIEAKLAIRLAELKKE